MSLQERKPKNRITQNPESQDGSKEVKVERMVYKSSVPRRLSSSSRTSTEHPKIMLKKIRSIKLYKVYSLKRRGTSQLDRMSTDSSSNDSSSRKSTPDSRMRSLDGKKNFEASPLHFKCNLYYIFQIEMQIFEYKINIIRIRAR